MVAEGAINSSIESQGSKPAAGRIGFHKHAQKKFRPIEPIRRDFSPPRMSNPNSTDDSRRGGILRRRSGVGNQGASSGLRPAAAEIAAARSTF
jgi:hypothetical protein